MLVIRTTYSPDSQAMLADGVPPPHTPGRNRERKALSPHRPRSRDEIHGMAKRLIGEDRYAFVLLDEAIEDIGDARLMRS